MNTRGTPDRGLVVAGFDGGQHMSSTLAAAADEAERRGVDLAVVTVLREHIDPGLNIEGLTPERRQAQAAVLQDLHQAAVWLHPGHPHLRVATYCLDEAEVAPELPPLMSAELLVIGTRGRYGRQALTLASVSRLLLTSSQCPLLIVPENHPSPVISGTGEPVILVGVSEHPADALVVHTAFEQAIGRGGEVLLLHAYSLRAGETPEDGRARAGAVLAGYVAEAPAGTRVSALLTEDEPAAALLRQTAGAILMVIGGREGALSGLIRGSVSRLLLENAPCPVLAVPRNLATAGSTVT